VRRRVLRPEVDDEIAVCSFGHGGECWRLAGSAGKDRTGEATAIRSMTRKVDEARIRQEMAAAIAAYAGPVTKCPPGKARGGTGKVNLLIRPRYRAKPPPVTPPRR